MFVAAYSEAELRALAPRVTSLTAILRHFGLRPAGGNFRLLRRRIEEWDISIDHFAGPADPPRRVAVALSEVLIEGSPYSRKHLKKRLYEAGLKQRHCELCGQGEEWRGAHMSLILDHINGIGDDNRLENLRIVCPNCAATLDTHCGRANRLPELERACPGCGQRFQVHDRRQRYCSRACGMRAPKGGPRPALRRAERPPYEELVAHVAAEGWSAAGRRYMARATTRSASGCARTSGNAPCRWATMRRRVPVRTP